MGYNAAVEVNVDALHQIEKDPEFGKNLVAAIKNNLTHDTVAATQSKN